MPQRRPLSLLPWATHIGSLLPLALLAYDFTAGNLTVNPIQDLTLRTGKAALVLLVLCLACTPASLLFGWKWAIRPRKALGLYSFLYVALHLGVFTLLDYGLDWGLIGQAVAEKRYVLAGFAAFVLLVPLAITSTKGWQRRLGKAWRRLHWLIYPAAILAGLHYLWLAKVAREPLIFLGITAALLAVRAPAIRRWLTARRAALSSAHARRAQSDPDAQSEPADQADQAEHGTRPVDQSRRAHPSG